MIAINKAAFNTTAKHPIALAILLFACVVPTVQASPKVVHASEVKSCHYLGQVNGHSKHSKHHDWKPSAKASALSHARKRGATHVVWSRFTPIGAFNGVAVANLYQCHHH